MDNIFHSSNPQPSSWSLLESHRISLLLYIMVCCCTTSALSSLSPYIRTHLRRFMKVIKALLIAECEPRSLFGGLASQPHLGDDCICAHDAEQLTERALDPQPDYPWQMVGTDLLGKDHNVLVVDYFSRYTKSSSYLLPLCQPLFLH